ncbi:hypothetical protein Q5O24_14880 [Eubacteriaceae bacterium ES3]|nr:hypothetical protein Q5O24_14880 [Eubacteriaceae bacterium ES3]
MKNHRELLIFLIITVSLIALGAAFFNLQVINIIVKPAATLLAWFSMWNYASFGDSNRKVKKIISFAFLAWFIVDLFIMTGEFYHRYIGGGFPPSIALEMGLYSISRLLIVIAVVGLYRYITRRISFFQVMADIITLVSCVILTLWLVFFRAYGMEYTFFN